MKTTQGKTSTTKKSVNGNVNTNAINGGKRVSSSAVDGDIKITSPEEMSEIQKVNVNKYNEIKESMRSRSQADIQILVGELATLDLPPEYKEALGDMIAGLTTAASVAGTSPGSIVSLESQEEAIRMAEKARELDKKWEWFEENGGVAKLEEDLRRNEERMKARDEELNTLLDPNHELTLEEIRRARESYVMTPEDLEERERWRRVHEMHRDASELSNYHSGVLSRIGEEGERLEHRSEDSLSERERAVLDSYRRSSAERDKAQKRYDTLNPLVDDRAKQRQDELANLLERAENAGERGGLLKGRVIDYFKKYQDEYKEEFSQNPQKAENHQIVALLVSTGLHEHLDELAKSIPSLENKAREAFEIKKEHDKIFEELPKRMEPGQAVSKTADPASKASDMRKSLEDRTSSTSTDNIVVKPKVRGLSTKQKEQPQK